MRYRGLHDFLTKIYWPSYTEDMQICPLWKQVWTEEESSGIQELSSNRMETPLLFLLDAPFIIQLLECWPVESHKNSVSFFLNFLAVLWSACRPPHTLSTKLVSLPSLPNPWCALQASAQTLCLKSLFSFWQSCEFYFCCHPFPAQPLVHCSCLLFLFRNAVVVLVTLCMNEVTHICI